MVRDTGIENACVISSIAVLYNFGKPPLFKRSTVLFKSNSMDCPLGKSEH